MELPPPTYGLLLGPTLLLLPFVVRWAAGDPAARRARAVLYPLALLELALILLYYSKFVCWTLAGAAAIFLARAAYPANRRAAARAIVPLALAAGLAFQFLPGEDGFVAYFALGLPLLFGLPLAALAGQWLRWDPRPPTFVAAAALVSFAGLFGMSAFAQDFLASFEVTQLPVLLLALAGFAWLLRRGTGRADAARSATVDVMTPGEYAARPIPSMRTFGILHAASAVAGLAGYVVLDQVGPARAELTYPGIALVLAGPLVATVARGAAAPVLAALLELVAALLLPVVPVAERYLGEGGGTLLPHLVVSGLAATLALLSFAVAWARAVDLRRRRQVLAREPSTPSSFLQRTGGDTPTVDQLAAFASEVRAHGAPGGVWVLHAPAHEPLWSLPEAAYAWLERENDPRARVHVQIIDGPTVYHVPPLLPEEQDL